MKIMSIFAASLAWLLAAAMLALLVLGPSPVIPFTPADAQSVRSVVEGQLDAFAQDDAARAFALAAPNVRQAAGTAPVFMAMVRRNYPVVYRPASVAFLKPDAEGDQVIQRVQMTDASGDAWLVIYSLQRQKSKAWRITGCQVVSNKGHMA